MPVSTHRMVAFGEYIDDDTASVMKARDYKDATDLVASTLRGEGFDASEDGTGRQNLIAVHGTQDPCVSKDIAFSLSRNNGGENCIAYGIYEEQNASAELMGCLKARTAGGGFEATVAFQQNQLGEVRQGVVSGTLNTNSNASGRNTPMAKVGMAVRRLTPVECERLQGFPDGYTNVPDAKGKPAADGPRYKALGNSWAVPNVAWIFKRINIVNRLLKERHSDLI